MASPWLYPGPLRRFHQILEFGGEDLTGLRVVAQRLDIGADVPGMENVQCLVNATRAQQPEQRVHQTVALLRIHGGDPCLDGLVHELGIRRDGLHRHKVRAP